MIESTPLPGAGCFEATGRKTKTTKLLDFTEYFSELFNVLAGLVSGTPWRKSSLEVDADAYVNALKGLGYSDEQLAPVAELKKVKIDGRGHSEKVAETLGSDYLGDNMIFLSGEQKGVQVKSGFSFMQKAVDEVFHSCGDYISLFSPHAPVYGTLAFSFGWDKMTVSGKVYNNTGITEKIAEARRKIDSLKLDDLLREDYLKSLTDETKSLRDVWGDIRQSRSLNDSFQSTQDVFLYKDDETEYFCLAGNEPLAIYFGKPLDFRGVKEVDGSDPEEVIREFTNRGMAFFDEDKKKQRLLDEEKAAFYRKGYGHSEVDRIMEMKSNPEEFLSYMSEWVKVKGELSDVWKKISENRVVDLDTQDKMRLLSVSVGGDRGETIRRILERSGRKKK